MFAGKLKLYLAQYREMLDFIKFGSEIDEETARILHRGERLVEILRQPVHTPRIPEFQIFMVAFSSLGYLDEVSMDEMPGLISFIVEIIEKFHADPVFKNFASYFRFLDGIRLKRIIRVFFKYLITDKYKINNYDFTINRKEIVFD